MAFSPATKLEMHMFMQPVLLVVPDHDTCLYNFVQGGEAISYLQGDYLPTLKMTPPVVEVYIYIYTYVSFSLTRILFSDLVWIRVAITCSDLVAVLKLPYSFIALTGYPCTPH